VAPLLQTEKNIKNKYSKKKNMQQPNIFSYSFSVHEKCKKIKPERKPQAKKKVIGYIDVKYTGRSEQNSRNEMDKDIVF
jgi:hypothetical protein